MLSGERLRREHEVIQEVLLAVEGIFPLNGRRAVPMSSLAGAVEFFEAFVERCHEAKEEQVLLPALVQEGLVDAAAVRKIEHDHAEGHRLLRRLRAACGRRKPAAGIDGLFAAYAGLQRSHMALENASVLPRVADLSAGDDARLHEGFDRIDEHVAGPGGREVLLALGTALTHACRAIGVGTPATPAARVAGELVRPPQGTVAPDASLSRAGALMTSLGTRELAVMDGAALVGILTRGDLDPYRGHLEWTPVRMAMTPDPVTVAPDTPIREVARTLLEHGFNSVPVADGRGVVGLVRRSDLLRLLEMEAETEAR